VSQKAWEGGSINTFFYKKNMMGFMMWITRNTIHLIRIGIVFSTFQQPINALQGINKCPFGVKDKLTIHGCYAAAQGEHKVRQLFMFVHKNLI
jgi:hypothetical protein